MNEQQQTTSHCMLIVTAVLAMLGTQCNKAHCEDLRDELFALRRSWQTCQQHSDCILVGGNPGDCTGILSCNLAVNRGKRLEAERRIASLPEETLDCMECQPPNCEKGEMVYCEPVTHLCIVITDVVDLDAGVLKVDLSPPGTGGRSSQSSSSTGGSRSSLGTGGTNMGIVGTGLGASGASLGMGDASLGMGGSSSTGVPPSEGTAGVGPVDGAAGTVGADNGASGNAPMLVPGP
jgi:hypothetical protein